MYLKVSDYYKPVLAIGLLATLFLGFLIFIHPPAIFPDPSWGFQVMRSMKSGGGFNLAITPSHDNIALDSSSFLAWWSPGQYIVPYVFNTFLGLNLGQSVAASILFCSLSGLFGFYFFFTKLGFSRIISALSIAFIICQQFYFIPYIFYNGGETILFGFLGWYLYGCFSITKPGWKLVVFVFISGWVGFFCKSAFLWMYASGLFCVWVNISSGRKEMLHWIKNGLLLAMPAILSLLAIFKFFLSKGENPASASSGLHFSLKAIGFPMASPLLSGFSADDLFHGLIYHPDGPVLSPVQTTMVLLSLAVLSVGLFLAVIRLVPYTKYKLVISVFYIISILFFSSVFLRQADISYESRHFRIVGLLFIPGTMYLSGRGRPGLKVLFTAIWIAIAFMSIQYFIVEYKYNATVNVYGPSNISQPFIDRSSLNYLQMLDKQHQNDAIFVFTSADLGLDIMHNRIITLDAIEDENKKTYAEDNSYEGHAGSLFILLPAIYSTNGNLQIIQQCFPDYSNFTTQKLSERYIMLSAQ